MDRKPWQNNGPHRAPFGADRREGGRSDRREGVGERGFGRGERREFGDRREFGERRGFGDSREFGERREFAGRREGERRPFGGERREFGGERRGFGDRDRRPAFGGQRRREEFGVRSGPRARALETRRFSERSDFAKSAIVKLDADLADYFDSAEAVNKALRMVVQLAQIAKKPTPAKVEEKTTEATEVAAEEAEVTEDAVADVADEAMFSEDDFEEQMPQADVEAEDKKAE